MKQNHSRHCERSEALPWGVARRVEIASLVSSGPGFALLAMTVLLMMPLLAFGQVVNPRTIYQDTDIALHNTNAYYAPFAPPGDTDTRTNLCSISAQLRDSDGVGNSYADYFPIVWDARNHQFDSLQAWAPCWDSAGGKWDTLGGPAKTPDGYATINGDTIPWMRLFTANDKPGGKHSDLIAGGAPGDRVIISKNEDVDFRATGRVILKSGFHAKPGCFFHAYTAPRWDTAVFSDEFNDSATFRNKWLVFNNMPAYDGGDEAVYDSNMAIIPDSTAHDSWALREDMKQDSTKCLDLAQSGCALDTADSTISYRFPYSGAMMLSCPFPFKNPTDPIRTAYEDAPYGKWEIREKIPDFKGHVNTYGGGQWNEFNLGEMVNDDTTRLYPGFTRRFVYGPFRGRFGILTVGGVDTGVFYSSEAHFTNWNNPVVLIVNQFPYEVQFTPSFATDTVLYANATTGHEGGFPSSLIADSLDSVTFYYYKNPSNVSDTSLYWSIDSTGQYFYGAYGKDVGGHPLYFNKSYQPTSIGFYDSTLRRHDTLPCHWDHNTGKMIFTQLPSDVGFHQGHGFTYTCQEGPYFPGPPIHVNLSDYRYHTYSMELLPHEARFLIDGHVMRRSPDRLIPPGYQQSDYVTKAPRAPMNILPAELTINSTDNDSAFYYYFKTNDTTCLGCWPVNGQPAEHHMIDYVKVFDVPKDVIIPPFPH